MTKKGTKTDRIRALLAEKRSSAEISRIVGCSPARVANVRWRDAQPGYNNEWMAKKRATDLAYKLAEMDANRERYRDEARECGREPRPHKKPRPERVRVLAELK